MTCYKTFWLARKRSPINPIGCSGKRWRVEILFSVLKIVIDKVINAKRLKYHVQEAVMKIYRYFLLRRNTVVN